MAVVFSKLSGLNDSVYKAVEGAITEIITDVTPEKPTTTQFLKRFSTSRNPLSSAREWAD